MDNGKHVTQHRVIEDFEAGKGDALVLIHGESSGRSIVPITGALTFMSSVSTLTFMRSIN
jgi:hypothetical protein